jgi:hypothetical protein
LSRLLGVSSNASRGCPANIATPWL